MRGDSAALLIHVAKHEKNALLLSLEAERNVEQSSNGALNTYLRDGGRAPLSRQIRPAVRVIPPEPGKHMADDIIFRPEIKLDLGRPRLAEGNPSLRRVEPWRTACSPAQLDGCNSTTGYSRA